MRECLQVDEGQGAADGAQDIVRKPAVYESDAMLYRLWLGRRQ